MKAEGNQTGEADTTPAPEGNDAAGTGLPGLHTWKAVYLFVLACFALSVGLLVALTLIYG